jgi:hypothetical protein
VNGLGGVQPETGGRVVLRLISVAEHEVVYACCLTEADLRLEGTARVALPSGTVLLQDLDAAPGWLVTLAQALLRGAWRSSGEVRWPRRITRWRAG